MLWTAWSTSATKDSNIGLWACNIAGDGRNFPKCPSLGLKFHSCQVYALSYTSISFWSHWNNMVFWYFLYAILRKVRCLGLMREYRRNRAVKKIAKMAMALAVLPSHLIRNGFEAIIQIFSIWIRNVTYINSNRLSRGRPRFRLGRKHTH